MGQCADCNGHVFIGMHHKCPVAPAPPVGDEAKHEHQPLIEAHVERLVAAELAHRKEIATLQAMVMELRGRLGEAERLLREKLGDAERLLREHGNVTCPARFSSGQSTGQYVPPAYSDCGTCLTCRTQKYFAQPPRAVGDSHPEPHAYMFCRFRDYCGAQIDGDYCGRRASHPIHAVPGVAK